MLIQYVSAEIKMLQIKYYAQASTKYQHAQKNRIFATLKNGLVCNLDYEY